MRVAAGEVSKSWMRVVVKEVHSQSPCCRRKVGEIRAKRRAWGKAVEGGDKGRVREGLFTGSQESLSGWHFLPSPFPSCPRPGPP